MESIPLDVSQEASKPLENDQWEQTKAVLHATSALNKNLFSNGDRAPADLEEGKNRVSPYDLETTLAANNFVFELTMNINDAALSGNIEDVEIPINLEKFYERVKSPQGVLSYKEGVD